MLFEPGVEVCVHEGTRVRGVRRGISRVSRLLPGATSAASRGRTPVMDRYQVTDGKGFRLADHDAGADSGVPGKTEGRAAVAARALQPEP